VTKQAAAAVETTDLAVLDEKLDKAIALMQQAGGRIGRVVAIANATKAVRELVVANWDSFRELKNSQLGWSTDERPGGPNYSDAVLQTALTQAILKGALPVNKEIGVISGQAYLQKSYFERQLSERADVSDVRIVLDVPELGNGRAIVGGVVSWRRDGKEDRIECRKAKDGPDQRIPVKVNAGMSDDAILGKATRKILARMLARVDGSQAWEDLGSEPDTVEGSATASPDASQAALPAPKPPGRDEIEAAFRAWSERIAASADAAEVEMLIHEARASDRFTLAPRTWQDKLVQRSLDRLAELSAAATADQAKEASAETLDQTFDRFIERLAQTKSVAEAGKVYDAFFAPGSAHKWTPEHEAAGAKAFGEHKELVRPK